MTAGELSHQEMPLSQLEKPLRHRVAALRRLVVFVQDVELADLISLVLEAAAAPPAAWSYLRQAEDLAATRYRFTVGTSARAARAAIRRGLHGRVSSPGQAGPQVIATDGSYDTMFAGWAYITGTGTWGCAGRDLTAAGNPAAPQGSLIMELRAAGMAIADTRGPARILIDSLPAIGFLSRWQAGDVTRMPGGYARDTRTSKQPPPLRLIAEAVWRRRDELTFDHVRGHDGHPLNEAAHTLANLARTGIAGRQDGTRKTLTAHACALVRPHLEAWDQISRDLAESTQIEAVAALAVPA